MPRRSTNVIGLLALAALGVLLGGHGAIAVGAGVTAGLLLPSFVYILLQQRRNRRRGGAGAWEGYCGMTAHSFSPLPAALRGGTSLPWSAVAAADVGLVPGAQGRFCSLLTLRLTDGTVLDGIVFGKGVELRATLNRVDTGNRHP